MVVGLQAHQRSSFSSRDVWLTRDKLFVKECLNSRLEQSDRKLRCKYESEIGN